MENRETLERSRLPVFLQVLHFPSGGTDERGIPAIRMMSRSALGAEMNTGDVPDGQDVVFRNRPHGLEIQHAAEEGCTDIDRFDHLRVPDI